MENDTVDMQRVWKEFGKHTEAGKLLYNIYGVKYNPEQHINYPKLILKTPEMKERERLEKERLKEEKRNKMTKAARKIDYAQGLRHYQPEKKEKEKSIGAIINTKNKGNKNNLGKKENENKSKNKSRPKTGNKMKY